MTDTSDDMETCHGCGGRFARIEGPTHRYMTSAPGCWAAYGKVLAAEYEDFRLMKTHRLTVDAYAIQHPGDGSRAAIQSVGLHLARLMVQLESPRPPRQTNDVMLGLARHKASLVALEPPAAFTMTVADVAPFAGTDRHVEMVENWARQTFADWHAQHDTIRAWIATTGQ
ncbi:DUF5946 family protein [Bauldia sp.]|uniref:DUF5946 family protein n=1 Tax=Bauldia sp. TaxID=2575872 RepID=UPI003BACDECB